MLDLRILLAFGAVLLIAGGVVLLRRRETPEPEVKLSVEKIKEVLQGNWVYDTADGSLGMAVGPVASTDIGINEDGVPIGTVEMQQVWWGADADELTARAVHNDVINFAMGESGLVITKSFGEDDQTWMEQIDGVSADGVYTAPDAWKQPMTGDVVEALTENSDFGAARLFVNGEASFLALSKVVGMAENGDILGEIKDLADSPAIRYYEVVVLTSTKLVLAAPIAGGSAVWIFKFTKADASERR